MLKRPNIPSLQERRKQQRLMFMYKSQRCQPSGSRTQDRSSAADPVSSEHPPTVVCVCGNDFNSIVLN
ncbi:hypothetical protein ACOMHN_037153 [Nucella lapillus]